MADYDNMPKELVELYAEFLRLDAECERISAELPPAVSETGEVVAMAEADRSTLDAARAERLRVMDEVHQHPWWAEVDSVQQARVAMRAAAQETMH